MQEMGSFAVAEHNRGLGGERKLLFHAVVRAERQVVAGIEYFLCIAAAYDGGAVRFFEAVVLVKPWLGSRQLLYFFPAEPKVL